VGTQKQVPILTVESTKVPIRHGLVAAEKGAVIDRAHALSDGWRGYLSVLVVGEHRRHEGIGGRLIDAMFGTAA
jgi:ribosomal protein S18 acetylase RimI-like enzyme